MKLLKLTRRGFLKAACIATGGALVSIRMTSAAIAKIKEIKDYMVDRINGVYAADAKFPVRASQDNAQVKKLYADFLGKPLSHKSESLLHTQWRDQSEGYKKLVASGVFPNKRDEAIFKKAPYPYEED